MPLTRTTLRLPQALCHGVCVWPSGQPQDSHRCFSPLPFNGWLLRSPRTTGALFPCPDGLCRACFVQLQSNIELVRPVCSGRVVGGVGHQLFSCAACKTGALPVLCMAAAGAEMGGRFTCGCLFEMFGVIRVCVCISPAPAAPLVVCLNYEAGWQQAVPNSTCCLLLGTAGGCASAVSARQLLFGVWHMHCVLWLFCRGMMAASCVYLYVCLLSTALPAFGAPRTCCQTCGHPKVCRVLGTTTAHYCSLS